MRSFAHIAAAPLAALILFAALAAPSLAEEAKPAAAKEPAPGPTFGEAPATGAVAEFLGAHKKFYDDMRRFTPMIELRGTGAVGAEVDTEPGEFDMGMLYLEAMVPIPISRDVALIAGMQTHARRYRFQEDMKGVTNDTLYGAGLRLGGAVFATDDLMIMGIWMPSIFSDFDGTLTHRDWYLWYGTLLATYRVSDTLFLKGGILLTDAFRDTGAVPLVGVSWLITERWRLDVLIPRLVEASYAVTPDLIGHFGFEIEGEEYRLRTDNSGREFQTNVQCVDIRLFLGVIHRFTKNISLAVRFGTLVGGTYDWQDGTGFDYDGKLEKGLFGTVGLGYTF